MKTSSILAIALLLSCTTNTKNDKPEALSLEVTGAKEAMPAFEKGYLLLHNFEYQDAAEAFVEAQTIDPTFVMAYWGEAMTCNHPLWSEQDNAKAKVVLQKLGATPEERLAKAKTELEKDFLKAVEVLYGEGSKADRDKAYSAHMEGMYNTYSGNHEIAAFYALSLLGMSNNGWNKDLYNKGASIAEAILKENPRHTGALHYLIHSDDHPEFAQYALAAANDYSKVASYAGHALHMPSHIYLALGMWDDVVRSNEVSWQAGVDRKVKKGLDHNALNHHAYLWLLYGYAQQGRYDRAREVFEEMTQFSMELPTPRIRAHLLLMKGHYLVESNDWTSAIAEQKVESGDLDLHLRSINRFIDGMKAFQQGDAKTLQTLIAEQETDRKKASAEVYANDGITSCGAARWVDQPPTQFMMDASQLLELELRGLIAWLNKDFKGAEKFLRDATAVEDKMGYFFGPPDIIKPSHELLGEFLTSIKQYDEAYAQLEESLRRAPGRLLSLKGQLTIWKLKENREEAAKIEKKLEEVLKGASEEERKKVVS